MLSYFSGTPVESDGKIEKKAKLIVCGDSTERIRSIERLQAVREKKSRGKSKPKRVARTSNLQIEGGFSINVSRFGRPRKQNVPWTPPEQLIRTRGKIIANKTKKVTGVGNTKDPMHVNPIQTETEVGNSTPTTNNQM